MDCCPHKEFRLEYLFIETTPANESKQRVNDTYFDITQGSEEL
jgi:hypothetical protein